MTAYVVGGVGQQLRHTEHTMLTKTSERRETHGKLEGTSPEND